MKPHGAMKAVRRERVDVRKTREAAKRETREKSKTKRARESSFVLRLENTAFSSSFFLTDSL